MQRGELTRVARGVFAPTTYANALDVRARAALLACDPDGRGLAIVTGAAALFLNGAVDDAPARVMVAVGRHHHVTRVPGFVTLYRCNRLPPPWGVRDIGAAKPEWALLHAMRELPVGRRLDFALYVLGRRMVDLELLKELCRDSPYAKGRREMLAALSLHTTGIDSPLELRGRREILAGPEFAGFRWQYEVTVDRSRFRLDAFDPETLLAIEFDGRRFHGRPGRWDADRQRDVLLASAGIQTLRLTNDMMNDPERCRDLVRRTMRARSRRRAA